GDQVSGLAVSPSGTGVPLLEPDSSFMYAELVDDCAYLLCHLDDLTGPALALFMRLVHRLARDIDLDAMIDGIVEQLPAQEVPASDTKFNVYEEGFLGWR